MSKKENPSFRSLPLFRLIIDILWRNDEGLYDKDILNILRNKYGLDVSMDELYSTLLKLEVNGLIYAERVGDNLLIKLNKEAFDQ